MTRITLAIDPLDVLFFRDGRPFAPGAVLTSGRPTPQTLAGALRTWVLDANGCDFTALGHAVRNGQSFAEALHTQSATLGALAGMSMRGPWFTCKGEPIVPAPATLRWARVPGEDSERIVRLNPLNTPLSGWRAELGEKPLWWRGKEPLKALSNAFLTMAGLRQFLNAEDPAPETVLDANRDLMAIDRRVRIQIASGTSTNVEGALFSSGFLALKRDVGLMAELHLPAHAGATLPATAVLPLGGEGRRVAVTQREPYNWPKRAETDATGTRRLLLLTTPALFDPENSDSDGNNGAWKPPGLHPVAAAVPRAEPVSGWDLARNGPKAVRFAVPAGTVYFLDRPLADDPPSGSLCVGEAAATGWGAFCEGGWEYA